MRSPTYLFIFCALTLICASAVPAAAESPRLSASDVTRLAKQMASERGRRLSDYLRPKAEFIAVRREWIVTFTGKVPNRGNYFDVRVDDRTRRITLVPGE